MSVNPRPADADNREFARIPVMFRARLLPVEPEDAERLRESLLLHPSVWAPTNESTLRDLVVGAADETQAMLAQSILDLTAQIVRLRSRVFDERRVATVVEVVELSGGGGRLRGELPLKPGDLLELSYDDEDDMPPVRAMVEIVHVYPGPPRSHGFRYAAIHPKDQDRMIRLIYQLQRRALRESGSDED